MKASFLKLMVLAFLLSMCNTVPLTGRKSLKLISSQEINALSFQQYDQLKQSENLSTNQEQVQKVQQVGQRIQLAIETFLRDNGHGELLEGFAWEFILIQSDQVNAFCMPGGKVAFYTGILPFCQDETGIAVVMGHEIAHAIAEHGNERMSQALVQQLGGIALSEAIKREPGETQQLFAMAYGLGSQYGVMLPFSRKHESEADELGLYFMAMAGYDPAAAPDFWIRMSKAGGQKPPEFMSTHPADETRAAHLKKVMPKAKEYYAKSQTSN